MGALEVYRYERKFIVTEAAAVAISQFVRAYLMPDAHMAAQGPTGYRVCSLYLDTPQLALYRQSAEGIKNRYKLRIRFYDEGGDSPAFLEIKKRTSETVHKLRAVVSKPAAERLLRGGELMPADLVSNSDTSLRALAEFCDCCQRLRAEGTAFVHYRREAYVSTSAESERVTFDRDVAGHRYHPGGGLTLPKEAPATAANGVVLELKYNSRAPRWMHDLVQSFGLQRRSVPKYVRAVDALKIAPEFADRFARSMHV
jgi:VTC domain